MTFNGSRVSIIGIVTVGEEARDKPMCSECLIVAWHVSIHCMIPRASHDIYA
jgi:hypothetical protein